MSTIIPCHNDAAWLPGAIESALAQTYRDHEVIVVDDGSTDETPEVLDRYAERIRIVRQPNRGLPAARNLGLRHASGEFVAFLDADDRFLPHALDLQVARLHADPLAGMAYSGWLLQASDGTPLGASAPPGLPPDGYLVPLFLLRVVIQPSAVMLRRTALDAVGWFDETLSLLEDTDLWMRVAHRFRVLEISEPLVVVTRRPHSLGSRLDRYPAPHATITDRLIALVPALATLRDQREIEVEMKAGRYLLNHAQPALAREHFRHALARDPRHGEARRLLLRAWADSVLASFGLLRERAGLPTR